MNTPNQEPEASTKLHVNTESRNVFDFYLTGAIEESEEYMSLYKALRCAQPNDIFNIRINSYGGSVYDTLQFISAINSTSASTIAHIEGMCYSAATFVALACDGVLVNRHSTFMCHHYSAGHYGKGHEIVSSVEFQDTAMKRLVRETYKYFMTKKEIELLIAGKDFWFDDTELSRRLERRQKKHEAKNKKEQKKQTQD